MKTKRWGGCLDIKVISVAAGIGLAGFSGVENAAASPARPGLVASLSAGNRASLSAEVAAKKRKEPQAFAALAEVKGYRPEAYRRTRSRRPEVIRELRALGPAGLYPMLEVLALTGVEVGEGARLDEGERVVLERGLLEAVGELRNPFALPILEAALSQASEAHVLAGAATGLGRLCGREHGARAEKLLLERSLDSAMGGAVDRTTSRSVERSAAVIEGLGYCRTQAAADRLAAILDGASDQRIVVETAIAIARQASSWAWSSSAKAGTAADAQDSKDAQDAKTGEAIRATGHEALRRAIARTDGETAAWVKEALVAVDPPEATKR